MNSGKLINPFAFTFHLQLSAIYAYPDEGIIHHYLAKQFHKIPEIINSKPFNRLQLLQIIFSGEYSISCILFDIVGF